MTKNDYQKEINVKKELTLLSQKNANTQEYACFLGAGAYNHWVPSTVDHLIGRSEFYTAYTPYQPEISQGTLQSIFEFQSWMCKLTGLDVANASLYDGATALAEAVLMALRTNKRSSVVLANDVHPAYRQVLETYLEPHGVEIRMEDGRWKMEDKTVQGSGFKVQGSRFEVQSSLAHNLEPRTLNIEPENISAVIVQQPSYCGDVLSQKELQALADKAHEAGALFIVCVDPLSLAIYSKPSEYAADIVVGEGQPFGMPLSYGGPYLGFMVVKEQYLRQLPGRVVGETVDEAGRRAFVLTMQTREQHIRREKATSNICSNEALCALAATVYLSLLGEKGLKGVAKSCKQKADALKKLLSEIDGVEIVNHGETFKEFAVRFEHVNNRGIPVETQSFVSLLNESLFKIRIIGGYELTPDTMLIAVTEMLSDEDLDRFVRVVRGSLMI